MANVTLAVADTRRTSNGLNVTDSGTVVGAVDIYFIPNNGRVLLAVSSTPGATVTVITPGTVDGLAIVDLVVTVAAAKQHLIGPFPPQFYNGTDGTMQVLFSAAASVYAVRM